MKWIFFIIWIGSWAHASNTWEWNGWLAFGFGFVAMMAVMLCLMLILFIIIFIPTLIWAILTGETDPFEYAGWVAKDMMDAVLETDNSGPDRTTEKESTFIGTATKVGIGYGIAKLTEKKQDRYAFRCYGCGHYEERSTGPGSYSQKCPNCGVQRLRGERLK